MDWSACFAPGMPGVVTAALADGGVTVAVQWFDDPALSADGAYRVAARERRMVGLTADLGSVVRGETVTVGGVSYQAVTDAEDDGHGVSTVYLEPS